MKHSAQTRICGEVAGNIRCHKTESGGVVANFTVEVTIPWGNGPPHTEQYKCVAIGKLGVEVEQTIKIGQLVSTTGFMRTSEWNDGSGKINHQLIVNELSVHSQPIVQHIKPPKKIHSALWIAQSIHPGIENRLSRGS